MFRRIFGGIFCLASLFVFGLSIVLFESELDFNIPSYLAWDLNSFIGSIILYIFSWDTLMLLLKLSPILISFLLVFLVGVYYLRAKNLFGIGNVAFRFHVSSLPVLIIAFVPGLLDFFGVIDIPGGDPGLGYLFFSMIFILLAFIIFIIGDIILAIGLFKNRKNNNKNAGF